MIKFRCCENSTKCEKTSTSFDISSPSKVEDFLKILCPSQNYIWNLTFPLKFIYSEKATNFCEISTVEFSYVVTVKSMMEISQNFVAFSEYMNFKFNDLNCHHIVIRVLVQNFGSFWDASCQTLSNLVFFSKNNKQVLSIDI